MSNHPLMNARHAGVRIPEAQQTGQAPALVVTKAVRLELALVEWSDERGMLHNSAAVIAGDKVFVNEQWTAAFRSMVEAMSKQVLDKLEAQDATKAAVVPSKDTVDILDEPLGKSDGLTEGNTGIDVFEPEPAPVKPKGK